MNDDSKKITDNEETELTDSESSAADNTQTVSDEEPDKNSMVMDESELPINNIGIADGIITVENTVAPNTENAENDSPDGEASEENPPADVPPVPITAKIRNALGCFIEKCGFPEMLLARFLGVYLIISGFNLISARNDNLSAIDDWKQFVQNASVGSDFLWLAFGFVLLTILYAFMPKKYRFADPLVMFAGTLTFSLSLMWRNNNFYLCIGVVAVSVVFVNYIIGKVNQDRFEKFPTWAAALIVLILTGTVTSFVAVTSVMHHKAFGTSTYDFGIFVQMFHSMVTDFSAVTTCERDTFLSHFYIHASFIYYLLAPVYALFPSESTLLIAQAVLAMGGVIPLFLIAKKHNYKGLSLVAICMTYIFCAGIIAPCYYDFHENAFLPTLLMWTLYAMDQKKYILFYIMSVLVCIVKEDAPLYIICIAMFFFFNEKSLKRLHGVVIAALSGVYFIIITNWLTENGDGSMMAATRFGNLTIDPEAGFGGIIMNVLTNPAYFFSLFVKEETLPFFLQVMLPLLFLPFITKKIHRFLLIIPFVIMNLVVGSGYGYAASIGFQYIFGPACLLIYMVLINCDDMERERRNMLTSSAAVASVIVAFCISSGNISYYENYTERQEHFQELEDCLDTIPEDASVASNTWYLPHIADRSEVYILDNGDFDIDPYDENIKTLKDINRYDFFVLAWSDDVSTAAVPQLEAAGYTLFNEVEGHMKIYVSPTYSAKIN